MWGGLRWAPTYVQAQAFLRLLQSSFQVNMVLMCYLCLCIRRYIVGFLWQQLEQQQCYMCSLQQTTNHEITCQCLIL